VFYSNLFILLDKKILNTKEITKIEFKSNIFKIINELINDLKRKFLFFVMGYEYIYF